MPFFVGLAVLKIKGESTPIYKDIIAFGYGIFYVFVMMTTNTTLTVMYMLPLASMLVLFKNRNFMIRCCIANMLVIIIAVVKNYMSGINSPSDISDYEIQVVMLYPVGNRNLQMLSVSRLK